MTVSITGVVQRHTGEGALIEQARWGTEAASQRVWDTCELTLEGALPPRQAFLKDMFSRVIVGEGPDRTSQVPRSISTLRIRVPAGRWKKCAGDVLPSVRAVITSTPDLGGLSRLELTDGRRTETCVRQGPPAATLPPGRRHAQGSMRGRCPDANAFVRAWAGGLPRQDAGLRTGLLTPPGSAGSDASHTDTIAGPQRGGSALSETDTLRPWA